MVPRDIKMPTTQDIIQFLTQLEGQPANKREIARQFDIKGADARIELRNLLKEMAADGLIMAERSKSYRLPAAEGEASGGRVVDLKAMGLTDDGEVFCEVVDAALVGEFPLIIVDHTSGVDVGDVFKAELNEFAPGEFMAHRVTTPKDEDHVTILGVYRKNSQGAIFIPLVKELEKVKFIVNLPMSEDLNKVVKDGSVVMGRPGIRRRGPTPIDIVELVQGSLHGMEEQLAIKNFDIPSVFPEEVLTFTKELKELTLKDTGDREDLRSVPLVTIDGEDSKDFDDAVWAEPWENGGHHIIVAIADVAHYVSQGSELDREAMSRGNSVYFPASVIPMLPERLSNDLCSLNPKVDRPAMVAHLYIDEDGELQKHDFTRAFIRSAARLTYNQVQKALDDKPCEVTEPVFNSTIRPLFNAYQVLLKAREKRGALDLDLPEKYIQFSENGDIVGVSKRERLDSHKLIEEMMVLANVAAATALETKGSACLYRIHPEPSARKIETLEGSLKPFGLKLDKGSQITPKRIQGLIERVGDGNEKEALHQLVLRSQEQARYDPENVGHFGLALHRYAHFTSPIRRYSDLVVHRSLIKTLKLSDHEKVKMPSKLEGVGEHLCITERRAQKAEWDVKDRLTTRFYESKVGDEYKAKVVTITNFGMFLSIDGGLAEGLLPLREMMDDHYLFDEKANTLFGRRTKKRIKIGDILQVKIKEADIVYGRMSFAPSGAESIADKRRPRRSGTDYKSKSYTSKGKPVKVEAKRPKRKSRKK